jgi:hypothetical protein
MGEFACLKLQDVKMNTLQSNSCLTVRLEELHTRSAPLSLPLARGKKTKRACLPLIKTSCKIMRLTNTIFVLAKLRMLQEEGSDKTDVLGLSKIILIQVLSLSPSFIVGKLGGMSRDVIFFISRCLYDLFDICRVLQIFVSCHNSITVTYSTIIYFRFSS